MSGITTRVVRGLNPNLPFTIARVTAQKLQKACEMYGINTRLQRAHFLGQLMAESGLIPQEENLNYSARRILQVWPSRFGSLQAAQAVAMRPEALANKVYGGRMGNKSPGDGYKYRGRGFIQLTGRNNYTHYGQVTGFDLVNHPDLLLQIGVSCQVAAAYWQVRNINAAANQDDVAAVTYLINGGQHGLETRGWATRKAFSLLAA